MNSEENRREEIKKEDSKNLAAFIIVLIIAGIAGGLIGAMMMIGKDRVRIWLDTVANDTLMFCTVSGGLFLVASVVLSIIIASNYVAAKKLWEDKEHLDDNWEKIEKNISRVLVVSTATYVILYALYGCTAYNLAGNINESFQTASGMPGIYAYVLAAVTVQMFVCIFFNLSFQKKAVNLEKLLNPEKKGSVYDFRFAKKWYESLDEAERLKVGIASYRAYSIVNRTCLVMMIVTILLGMIVKITVLPVFIIATLWLIQILSFGLESLKNSTPTPAK